MLSIKDGSGGKNLRENHQPNESLAAHSSFNTLDLIVMLRVDEFLFTSTLDSLIADV